MERKSYSTYEIACLTKANISAIGAEGYLEQVRCTCDEINTCERCRCLSMINEVKEILNNNIGI